MIRSIPVALVHRPGPTRGNGRCPREDPLSGAALWTATLAWPAAMWLLVAVLAVATHGSPTGG